jgi:hypothetical protein
MNRTSRQREMGEWRTFLRNMARTGDRAALDMAAALAWARRLGLSDEQIALELNAAR